jgi:hypothetical protein
MKTIWITDSDTELDTVVWKTGILLTVWKRKLPFVVRM